MGACLIEGLTGVGIIKANEVELMDVARSMLRGMTAKTASRTA